MANKLDYTASVEHQRLNKMHELLHELPAACWDFILSIEETTSLLTRFAYTYDLRVFFHYLVGECEDWHGLTVRKLTDADIAKITARDLEWYQHYLTRYEAPAPPSKKAIKTSDASIDGNESILRANAEQGKMRKLSTLRSFFQYLYQQQRIPSDVTALVPLPKLHEKPIVLLAYDEVSRLLDLVESGDALTDRQQKYHALTRKRDVALITLLLGTGIRISECVGINLQDVDMAENAVLITRKGGDQVILYYPNEVKRALADYLKERGEIDVLQGHENAFFLSLQRRRITQRAVQLLVKKYAAHAVPLKKKISPHKLRSTFGTHLYHETGDIYLVADVLGHADVNTTRKHYAAQSDERRRMAARSVKLREEGDP